MNPSTRRSLTAAEAQRIVAVIEALPHNAKLGIKVVELALEGCTSCIEHRPELVGHRERAVLHGGVVTTLIDATAGAAVYTRVVPGTPIATLDMRIDYLRPAEPGRRLYARGEVYRLTRQIAFARATAYQDEPDNQVAHCAASFMTGGIGLAI